MYLPDLPVISLFFLTLNKYLFFSHPLFRCEAKWVRKTVVGRVVGETHITCRAALFLCA